MPWQILPIEHFSDYHATWDQLNDNGPRSPLLEARFVQTAVKHFGNGRERFALRYDGEQVTSAAVFSPASYGCWATFQPSQSPLGAWLQAPGMDSVRMAKELILALGPIVGLFSLTQQDPDLLPRPSTSPMAHTLDYIQTARITLGRTFDAYWQARGKNLRHNLKRQRNRLEREGIITRLLTLTDPKGVPEQIRAYGTLESAGWKFASGTAISKDNAQGRFYSELLSAYCSTGDGIIYAYYYDDKIAAIDLCIRNRSTLVILKTTYDESIKTSSPAMLMRYDAFPALFGDPTLERIEFYGAVMDWHRKWSEEIRTLYHLNVYRHPWLARLHKMLRHPDREALYLPSEQDDPKVG